LVLASSVLLYALKKASECRRRKAEARPA